MNTESSAVIAVSDSEYDKILRHIDGMISKVEKLSSERDEYKEAYKQSIDVALKTSIEHENLKKRESSLAIMLGQACDEMEGIFRTTGSLASVEIAPDYTVWARYLEVHYGRKEHFAYEVQEWIDGN